MISGKPAQDTLLWWGMKWVSALRKKCPYSELLWSVLSCIRTEYGEIQIISPYSVRMRENAEQNNSKYEYFLRSAEE